MSTEIHGCLLEWVADEKLNWMLSDLLTFDEGFYLKNSRKYK